MLIELQTEWPFRGWLQHSHSQRNETFGFVNAESWLKVWRLHGILPCTCKHLEKCSVSLPGKTCPCPPVGLQLGSCQHRDHWETSSKAQPSFVLWTRRARCRVIRKQMTDSWLLVEMPSMFIELHLSGPTIHLRGQAEPDFYPHYVDEE